MANLRRTSSLLVRALVNVEMMSSSKAPRGGNNAIMMRANTRRLSCGAMAARRATRPLSSSSSSSPIVTPSRTFISLAVPIAHRRIEYTELRTVEYTPEQMYNVVASVDQYRHFVPWCNKSRIMKGRNGDVRAELEIGFPPLIERYTSELTVIPNHEVRALCTDGSLFSHLETVWRFSPGARDRSDSCQVDFHVSFEFRSLLHSQLATLFFDEVVKRMVRAFELRAAKLYGSDFGAAQARRQMA